MECIFVVNRILSISIFDLKICGLSTEYLQFDNNSEKVLRRNFSAMTTIPLNVTIIERYGAKGLRSLNDP